MLRLCLRLSLSLAVTLPALPLCSLAQSQNSQSVADAARRAREAREKAPQHSQNSKVITDDDIKPSNAKPTTDSATPAAPSDAARAAAPTPATNGSASDASTPAEGASASAPTASPEQQPGTTDSPEVAEAKRALAEAEKELDFLKRELNLDQDTFFSDPGHDRDAAGKAKLAGEQQQVDTKQVSVEDLKARLAKLLASAKSPEPPTPPQS